MNKQLSLPSEQEEIHIVTAAGKTVFICESVERALIYWEEMLPRPVDWRVVKVTTMKDDITPRQMLPKPESKSATVTRIARERNLSVVDAPLAISA